ncbi:MAG: DUF1134 domain-containing protein [Aestuariivirga sp.]|uniref:DUF1134 domain-containing protein n=1 Tax=Aestuariivirga sp. TaxID=2650926 RepID=UPI0025BB783E|nr:DUF1134 domain-containing protein [Aestuariivirga sp.]MCA3559817.1 DUF1134 domain-containing protein [Aestuariivirga sp.]
MLKKSLIISLALSLMAAAPLAASAQTTGSVSKAQQTSSETFTPDEIVTAGHQFFGKASRGLARAVESVFDKQGQPTAYIVGEEMAGSFVGGLRYGEGTIYYKTGEKQRIYWQGPSVGFDFGGNGSRSLVLVYNSYSPSDLYTRFGGVEGSAYFIGGFGVNFQQQGDIVLAPIRTGVGARLGANVGYLKYSGRPTWNPF